MKTHVLQYQVKVETYGNEAITEEQIEQVTEALSPSVFNLKNGMITDFKFSNNVTANYKEDGLI